MADQPISCWLLARSFCGLLRRSSAQKILEYLNTEEDDRACGQADGQLVEVKWDSVKDSLCERQINQTELQNQSEQHGS